MGYEIATRPLQLKTRGRKRSVLSAEVAAAVQQAIGNREIEAVIGVASKEEGAKLFGAIKARVRDGSFGSGLSVRGAVAESSTGNTVVVFSVLDYKPHSKPRGSKDAPEQVAEAVVAPELVVEVSEPEESLPAEPAPAAVATAVAAGRAAQAATRKRSTRKAS